MKNILIAFSGFDGTGKSTLAAKLKIYLEKNGHKVGFRHAHGYTFSENSFGISTTTVSRFKWLFKLASPAILIDSWITYLFKYRFLLKDKVLICDRYFYDKVSRLLFYKIIGTKLARIYLNLLPKPEYIFILDLNENKTLQRKKEYSKNQIKRFRRHYKFIANQLKIALISTSSPVDDILQKIILTSKLNEIKKK